MVTLLDIATKEKQPEINGAKLAEMKAAILKFLDPPRVVTFTEMVKGIEGFSGDYALARDELNLVVWMDFSKEAYQACKELLHEDKIHFKPVSVLLYSFEGGPVPAYPVASGMRAHKTLHWLPTAVILGPWPNDGDTR